jgi:hypothetical protein
LLCRLIERRPAVVEKAALRAHLWPGVHVVDASLSNLISELRSVLAEHDPDVTFIRTVHGVGYAFAADAHGGEAHAPRASDAASGARCWLVDRHRLIALPVGEHVIGRDTACMVWLDVEGVSRRHASIRVPIDPSAAVTIEDLASTNGTFVEGRSIGAPSLLKNGDRIRMGRATLIFKEQTGASAKTRRVRPASSRS